MLYMVSKNLPGWGFWSNNRIFYVAYNETPPSMKGSIMTTNFNARPAVAAVVSALNIKNTFRSNRAAREAIAQSHIHARAQLATNQTASRMSELGIFEGKTDAQITAWYESEYAAQVALASQK